MFVLKFRNMDFYFCISRYLLCAIILLVNINILLCQGKMQHKYFNRDLRIYELTYTYP